MTDGEGDWEIVVYYVGGVGVGEVWRSTLSAVVEFSKVKRVENYGDVETNLWK